MKIQYEKLPNPLTTEIARGIPIAILQSLYVTMLRIRKLEEKVAELLLQGEIKCPTHLYIGQEGIATGVCANLEREDLVFSTTEATGILLPRVAI